MEKYDLVIIGSGAGLNIMNTGLQVGMKVALIEATKLGGTCLTRGCIPSKILVHPADLIREAQHAKKVGLSFKLDKFDWKQIADRMWKQINESEDMERAISHEENPKLYKGRGEFTGEYEMQVISTDGKKKIGEFSADRFVIASGARPIIPPIDGIEDTGYVTTRSFFGDKFPKEPWESIVLIGGGIVAAEFAHIFSAFGTDVTVVEMLPRLINTEEPEVSSFVEKIFRKNMNVLLNQKAVKAYKKKRSKIVVLENTETGEKNEIKADEIFISAGRRSNADILKVENTGVETDEKGWIKTNKYLETTKENIWCIGDANGLYQFRHKANYEAEICMNNIFGDPDNKKEADYSAVPWAIYTYPQVGHVGITQQEAIDKGHKIFNAIKNYSSTAKGNAMGYDKNDEDDGFVKLVVDQSYKILGAHVVGPHAAVLVQPFVYLMNAGYTCKMPEVSSDSEIPKNVMACPEAGSFMPIYKSMVIHPSLNEVTGWAIGNLRPVNIKMEHHEHQH